MSVSPGSLTEVSSQHRDPPKGQCHQSTISLLSDVSGMRKRCVQTAELFFSCWIYIETTGHPLHRTPTSGLLSSAQVTLSRVSAIYTGCLHAYTLLCLHSQPRAWMDLVRAFRRESLHLPSVTQPKLVHERVEVISMEISRTQNPAF